MTAPTRIDTDRLVLAPPEAADAAAIFERYASDADVTRYVGWPRHGSLADTESFLAFSAVEWARAGAGPYLIRSRLDGRLFGGTGLHVDVPGVAMTGYVLAKDAWGLGYATEALRAMIDAARAIRVTRFTRFATPITGHRGTCSRNAGSHGTRSGRVRLSSRISLRASRKTCAVTRCGSDA